MGWSQFAQLASGYTQLVSGEDSPADGGAFANAVTSNFRCHQISSEIILRVYRLWITQLANKKPLPPSALTR